MVGGVKVPSNLSYPTDKKDKTMAEKVDIAVGEMIRALRFKNNMTQSDLSQALSISFQQIQKYETGKNRVSASMLAKIAATFNVPIGHFFGDSPLTPFEADRQISELLDRFEKMSDRKKMALLKIAREM